MAADPHVHLALFAVARLEWHQVASVRQVASLLLAVHHRRARRLGGGLLGRCALLEVVLGRTCQQVHIYRSAILRSGGGREPPSRGTSLQGQGGGATVSCTSGGSPAGDVATTRPDCRIPPLVVAAARLLLGRPSRLELRASCQQGEAVACGHMGREVFRILSTEHGDISAN